MIPVADIAVEIPTPLPDCELPSSDEVTEEGFGFFRGTWYLGRVSVRNAIETVEQEAECIAWLDRLSERHEQFEALAKAIEHADPGLLPEPLRTRVVGDRAHQYFDADDEIETHWLDGLEIGVAGLTHALSTVRCLTAASCRAHHRASWSDCPVVFFAAASWRIPILAGLAAESGCGLEEDRGMLKVYAPSVRHTNGLARHLLVSRARFRRALRTNGRSAPRISRLETGNERRER